ncbi:MAG: type II secretion system major pseudopilin GspG [Pseudomonadota bacterium]
MRSAGFTLIEIMVVVVILGILLSVVVPQVMNNPDKARIQLAKQNIRAIESALDLYRLNHFKYPTTDEGLGALVSPPGGADLRGYPAGGYMKTKPMDPWNNEYVYLNPGTQGAIDIYSLGADGQPGGDGINADIGNWELN